MAKKNELSKLEEKATKDSGYSRKIVTDYQFAKQELAKADVNLTQDQHKALSELYSQVSSGGKSSDEEGVTFGGSASISGSW